MARLTTGRLFWGLVITGLGIAWLCNNLGLSSINVGEVIRLYWPVIPIYFGLAGLFEVVLKRGWGSRGILWGSLIINLLFTLFFVGLLGNSNDWWAVDLGLVWKLLLPAALLVIGFSLIFGGFTRPGAKTYVAVMSGAKEVRRTWEDLAIINVMGGSTIDLSQAGLPDRDVLIDIYAIMGGGDLRLPEGVTVVCEWTGIMGGVKVFGRDASGVIDHRTVREGDGPVVRVRALTVMGGFDIKRAGSPRIA